MPSTNTTNEVINIEFSCEDLENLVPLERYLDHLGFGHVAIGEKDFLVVAHSVEDAKVILDRVLQDYESMGMEIPDEEFDILDLVVYCSNHKLQNWFMNRRISIQEIHADALSDMMSELASTVQHNADALEVIDSENVKNGLYRFREIVTILCNEVDNLGAHAVERINQVLSETRVH